MVKVRVTVAVATILRLFLEDVTSPRYGYELMRATGFPSGKLYPILLRLEQAGWLTKEQESVDPHEEGRPPRRLYRLTASGADAARHELACLRQQLTTARLPSRLGYAAGAQ